MSKIDYTYTINDNVILVIDSTSGGAAITNCINDIAAEITVDANLSYDTFMMKHFIYRNHRGKYNGVRFNQDKSVQFFSLNASTETKAIEYLKRVKLIHS